MRSQRLKALSLIELFAAVGLTLPSLTVYWRWPEFVPAYCGVALLAFMGLARFLSRGSPNVS